MCTAQNFVTSSRSNGATLWYSALPTGGVVDVHSRFIAVSAITSTPGLGSYVRGRLSTFSGVRAIR